MAINAKWRDNVRQELKKGGSEAPCPFCGLPRVKRSDYLRCAKCGINWLEGEALDKDPRTERQRSFVAASLAMTTGRKKEEPHAGR